MEPAHLPKTHKAFRQLRSLPAEHEARGCHNGADIFTPGVIRHQLSDSVFLPLVLSFYESDVRPLLARFYQFF